MEIVMFELDAKSGLSILNVTIKTSNGRCSLYSVYNLCSGY